MLAKIKFPDTALSSFLLVTIFIISHGRADVTCPKQVTIEERDTAIVSCKTAPKQIVRVYWYKGDAAKTNPILRLENGVPGGTEYGDDHYNISSSGAMIISNANIMHEALYTTFIYFHDGTRLSRKIVVNITISPWHSCPLIGGCVPCEECNLAQNGTGKLTCTISGVRPMIQLRWIVKSQNGIVIVEHPTTDAKDDLSDTWNSSVEISYEITSCNQEAIMECSTKDPFNLLENSTSSIRVYSGNCSSDILVSSTKYSLPLAIVIMSGVITIIAAALILIFRTMLKKELSRSKGRRLVSCLKDKYRDIILLNPLPSENGIEVEDLYIDCPCIVTYKNGSKAILPSDKLPTCIVSMDETFVLLTGVISYWESLFTKQFILQWIRKEDDNFTVLFINKREIISSVKVIDLLQEESSIESDVLIKHITNRKCIILIHGLTKLLSDGNEEIRDQHVNKQNTNAEKSFKNLTFSEIFESSGEVVLGQTKVIVTMSSEFLTENEISRHYVKVTLDHVEKQQFEKFIEKVFYCCIDFNRTPLPEEPLLDKFRLETENETKIEISSNSNRNRMSKSRGTKQDLQVNYISTKTDYASLPKIVDQHKSVQSQERLHFVKTFIEDNQFYREFMTNPIALSMVVNVVMKMADFPEVNSLSKVEVVCVLVKSLQEAYYAKEKDFTCSEFDVNGTLGKLALELIKSQSRRLITKTSPLREGKYGLNVALEMGLLQHSINIQETDERRQCTGCVEIPSTFLHYFAANYIVQNKLYYTGKSQEPGVAEFMDRLAQNPVKHFIYEFRKLKTDDDVMFYLHQLDDTVIANSVMHDCEGRELRFEKLNINEYKRAVAEFCDRCSQMQIRLKTISISGHTSMPFLRSLSIPPIEELHICGMPLMKEDVFFHVLEWISAKDIVLRFLKCQVPQTFSEDFKQKIFRLGDIKLRTTQNSAQTEYTSQWLNYENATWTEEGS